MLVCLNASCFLDEAAEKLATWSRIDVCELVLCSVSGVSHPPKNILTRSIAEYLSKKSLVIGVAAAVFLSPCNMWNDELNDFVSDNIEVFICRCFCYC